MPVFSSQSRLCAAAILVLLAGCATMRVDGADTLAARVAAVLDRRGLGPDALAVIDNIVRHEAPPPPAAPSIVRELLAQPLAAVDAATLFDRAVPAALRRLAEAAAEEPRVSRDSESVQLDALLAVYLDELAAAQRVLHEAAAGRRIDGSAALGELARQPPSPGRLRSIAAAVDPEKIERATLMFLEATARFMRELRAAGPFLQYPDATTRLESAVGPVVIGTRGDDVHGPEAAVIIDPGGNDVYQRAPATDGAVSVIIDLGGDDRYHGSDVVVHGLSAIIDVSGNDRYTMAGPGLGAAIAGAAVLVDIAGDDIYEAEYFGQGAAAFGFGALIDMRGNDAYRLRAGGQGFGMAGGVGLLWDRAGDDTYTASGFEDAFGRGGGISSAQGAAFGFRTMVGAGIGILRDDAGDDVYEAQMFAQGMGFYYGVGLLWDRGGDDRYRAVRYAQGNGVHEAVGVLRDESGNDYYELTVGVGQGMGLDLAVGVLFDGAGDDYYQSPVLAQGTATANGVGIVIDGGGTDRWEMGADRRSWGHAEWLRGLPSLGLLLYDPSRAVFVREGKTLSPPPFSADFGGPLGDAPVTHEQAGKGQCPEPAPELAQGVLPLAAALRRIAPGLGGGAPDPEAYAEAQHQLKTRLQEGIAGLPRDSFNIVWALGTALGCTIAAASDEEAAVMWTVLEQLLGAEPATPFAGAIAAALRSRPPAASRLGRMLTTLAGHPRCGVRDAALSLRLAAAGDEASRESVVPHAQAALGSPCWRLQSAARNVLRQLGVNPDEDAVPPSFLRADPEKSRRPSLSRGVRCYFPAGGLTVSALPTAPA